MIPLQWKSADGEIIRGYPFGVLERKGRVFVYVMCEDGKVRAVDYERVDPA